MARFQPGDPANERSLARRRPDAAADSTPQHAAPLHPLLALQRQVGNAQIARMLAQREGEEEEVQAKRVDRALAQREGAEEEELQAKRIDRALAQREGVEEEELQAKRIDRAVAQREAEEEEVQAKRVDRMLAQREGAEEEELQMQRVDRAVAQREGEPVVGPEGGEISSDLTGQINARRGQGSAIDEGTRSSLEAGFGTSFSDVRVHTDSTSDSLNRSLGAKAFTTGSDIFFSSGAYQPGSSDGKTLLSHELTHVVQQRSMTSSGGPMRVTAAGDAHEQEADAVAQQVVSNPAPAQRQTEGEE
jgi:flagellar biosynthesis GTPase FlhF